MFVKLNVSNPWMVDLGAGIEQIAPKQITSMAGFGGPGDVPQ